MKTPCALSCFLALWAIIALHKPAPSRAADLRRIRIPLEITAGQGCVHDAQNAALLDRVAVAGEKGCIAIEAEHPSRHFCNPKARRAEAPLAKDPEASGGGMLDHALYARYDLRADKEGAYDLWLRLATAKGRNRHAELLNGRRFIGPFLEDNEKEGTPYRWVKRARIKLNTGLNFFELINYHGPFPKVDKIVFAPAGTDEPTGKGLEARVTRANEGWVETAPLRIPGVQRIVAVDGAAGDVKISTDDGASWTSFGDQVVDMPKGAAVRFRIGIKRAADGKSPKVGPLAVQAEVDPKVCIELKNETTRLLFDRATGGLFLVESLTTGDAVVSPGAPRPLAAVEFKKMGEAEWLRVGPESRTKVLAVPDKRRKRRWNRKEEEAQPSEIRPESVNVAGNRIEAVYQFAADGVGKARVTYVIEPGADGLWRFAATTECLEGPADVTGVVFPVFEHVRIGASGLDDHQLRLQSFGHHVVQPGKGPIRDTRYLGGTVIPWTEVYDDRTGFYVCPYDPEALNTLYESKAGGQAAEFFGMSTTKLHPIKPGEKRTDVYAVAAHPGQWRWGADRYRKWFYKTHGRARYPEWMYSLDGWINLQAENYGKAFRFSMLPDWLTRGRSVGLDWVQVWGQFAYDGGPCCCAVYPLSPLYGGVEGWKAAVKEIKRRKGHVGGYFVYDRMDILPLVSDTFLGHFKLSEYPADTLWTDGKFASALQLVVDPAGRKLRWPPSDEERAEFRKKIEEHQRLYAAGKRARPVQGWVAAYLNDPRWREYLRCWIVDKYVKEYGCNSVYIDVLGCGGARESFDARRGHNGYGDWGAGKKLIAKTVVEAARKEAPDFAASQEGLGDLSGLYCMPMCSGVYRGGRNVYRYTFPERILMHGITNPGSGGSAMDRFLDTHLEGMRYDIVGRPTALPVALLNLRRQFAPLLYKARFRDTVGLTISDPRVHARLHLVETDELQAGLITLVNRERLDGVRVRVNGRETGEIKAAFFAGMSGAAARLDLERDGDDVIFDTPKEVAATILLPVEVKKGSGVWPVFTMKRTPPPAARVTLLNLTGAPVKGACRIETLGFTEPFESRTDDARAQLGFTHPSQEVSLEPLSARTLSFPIRSLRNHCWTVRVKATVDMGEGGAVARTFLATPLVPDGSWEFFGKPEASATDGERTLTLPPTDSGFQHQSPNLWLEAGRRYRLELKARRSGFDAAVRGTLLVVASPTEKTVWEKKALDPKHPNEWQTITYEFETPPDLIRSAIYLYNVRSKDTAWFDDLHAEERSR